MTERSTGLDIWLAFCDKKQELEEANEEIERLRAENAQLTLAGQAITAHAESALREIVRLTDALDRIVKEGTTKDMTAPTALGFVVRIAREAVAPADAWRAGLKEKASA